MTSNGQHISRTMMVLIVVACIALIAAGLAPTGWIWAAGDQPAGQGGTVPTRTPPSPPAVRLYLPIVARFG